MKPYNKHCRNDPLKVVCKCTSDVWILNINYKSLKFYSDIIVVAKVMERGMHKIDKEYVVLNFSDLEPGQPCISRKLTEMNTITS